MAQAEEARDRLCAAHPGLTVEIVPVLASGDKIQDRPLAEIGGKALWTKELDAWLLAGEIDFAVHSAKDVETLRPPGITIACVLPRADVRDVLVGAESLEALPPGARIGTSAPRRAAQALHFRPDCRIVVLTGYGAIATAVAAVKIGATDYLSKPADANDVTNALLSRTETLPTPPENPMSADRVRWEHIQRVYEMCDRNVSETARRLSMHRRTLQRILAKRSPK